jgi:hypothetical protein
MPLPNFVLRALPAAQAMLKRFPVRMQQITM